MRATVSKRDMIKTILICGVVISIVLCTLGLIAQTFLPVMRMNVIGPERIWYSSIDVPFEHVTAFILLL